MKLKYFILIFILLTVLYGLTDTPVPLQVWRTNGVVASPTNFWRSNVVAGTGIQLAPTSSNITVAVDTGVVAEISDLVWTNYGADAYTLRTMPGTILVLTNGVISAFETGTNFQAHMTNGGFSGLYEFESTRCKATTQKGGLALGYFVGAGGGIGPELPSFDIQIQGIGAGVALGAADDSTNCVVTGYWGGYAAGLFDSATNCAVSSINGGAFAGLYAVLSYDCRFQTVNDGSMAGAEMLLSSGNAWSVTDGSILFGRTDSTTNIDAFADNGGLLMIHARGSSNTPVFAKDASIMSVFLAHATNTGSFNVAEAQVGSLAVGIVSGAERLFANGSTNGVGAFAFGRDVASTNNWTFGIHYTNHIPLSLAVGADGTTQFRAASNSVVIRTETAPTVGQILTATDTSGTVGWSNAPAASGGGIASIFTNNVLAGGPGLTELEFTNTATVTWAATTNAGRVTMSATSAGGGSGIATNDGTGWNTTFLTQTNHNQIVFTNGSKIGATATNTLTLTNSHLVFATDNLWDIGASGATRPRNIYPGNTILAVAGAGFPQYGVAGTANQGMRVYSDRIDFWDAGSPALTVQNSVITFNSSGGTISFAGVDSLYHRADGLTVGTGGQSGFGNLTASNVFVAGRLNVTNSLAVGVTTVSLTSDNQSVSATNRSYIQLSSDDGTAGNRTFVLSSGTVVGQMLDLEWVGTNAGEILDDFSATGGGNGRLSATWTPTQYDVIGLRWNGTDWIERFRSTN